MAAMKMYGRPVVGLAHHQPGPHAERDVDDRGVGLGHATGRRGACRVRGRRRRLAGGVVEQGQVDPRRQQDHEAVHGDLADHERPVVREDLVHRRAEPLRRPQAVVGPVQRLLRAWPACGRPCVPPRCSSAYPEAPGVSRTPGAAVPEGGVWGVLMCSVARPVPEAGADRLDEVAQGDQVAIAGRPPGGAGAAASRPGRTPAWQSWRMLNVDWWQGQMSCIDQHVEQADGAPGVGADLGEGDDAVGARRAPRNRPGPAGPAIRSRRRC